MADFTIYLAPGWNRVDLLDDRAVDSALSRLVRSFGLAEQPRVREVLETDLRPSLTRLQEGGALCVLMPRPLPIPGGGRPFVVVTPVNFPEDFSPTDFLAAVASTDRTAELVDIPGCLALRTHASRDRTDAFLAEASKHTDELARRGVQVSPEAEGDVRLRSDQVTYLTGDPEDHERWLTFTLVVGTPSGEGGDTIRGQSVALFDAMVRSLRWIA